MKSQRCRGLRIDAGSIPIGRGISAHFMLNGMNSMQTRALRGFKGNVRKTVLPSFCGICGICGVSLYGREESVSKRQFTYMGWKVARISRISRIGFALPSFRVLPGKAKYGDETARNGARYSPTHIGNSSGEL